MSVRFGDQWYSYSRIEPFATTVGLTVDWLNALRSGDPEKTVKLPFNSLVGQARDKTFLSGVGDIIEALELDDPVNSLSKWASNFATSWVPNLVRSGVREADAEVKQTRVWGDGTDLYRMIGERTAQKAGIPLVETYPIYDVWGRPAKRSDIPGPAATDWLYRMTVPIRVQADQTFVADRVILNYNAQNQDDAVFPRAPAPTYSVGGETRYMTDAQYADFTRLAGEASRFALERFGLDPDAPTTAMVDTIASVTEKARTETKRQLVERWSGKPVEVNSRQIASDIADRIFSEAKDTVAGVGAPDESRAAKTPYRQRVEAFKVRQDRAVEILREAGQPVPARSAGGRAQFGTRRKGLTFTFP